MFFQSKKYNVKPRYMYTLYKVEYIKRNLKRFFLVLFTTNNRLIRYKSY